MKLIASLLLWLILAPPAFALEVPALRGHVNDYAGMLSTSSVAALERQLQELERSDSTQLVVLTVPTLGGEPVEEFAIKVAEAWKIGRKGIDNGVILLVAKAERKIRIEVGRGLEGQLTDLISGRIIRGDIAPLFKAGNFEGGITAGVQAIVAVVKGEYQAAPRDLRHGKRSAPPLLSLLLALGVAVVFAGALSRQFAGLVGAAGLPVIAWLTAPGLALAILAGLAVAGFVLGLLLSLLFGGGGRGGYFGGGGFYGGGYFGGGGGGGADGGFSGGGGDFGGGGASGDW